MTYKLFKNLDGDISVIKTISETSIGVGRTEWRRLHIPFDDDNRDYVEYKEWLAEGNTPAASDNL